MAQIVYHHVVNGCLWSEKFAHVENLPILPDAGDLVSVVGGDGKLVIDSQQCVDRHFRYDARIGQSTIEILLKDPEELHAEQFCEGDEDEAY